MKFTDFSFFCFFFKILRIGKSSVVLCLVALWHCTVARGCLSPNATYTRRPRLLSLSRKTFNKIILAGARRTPRVRGETPPGLLTHKLYPIHHKLPKIKSTLLYLSKWYQLSKIQVMLLLNIGPVGSNSKNGWSILEGTSRSFSLFGDLVVKPLATSLNHDPRL